MYKRMSEKHENLLQISAGAFIAPALICASGWDHLGLANAIWLVVLGKHFGLAVAVKHQYLVMVFAIAHFHAR